MTYDLIIAALRKYHKDCKYLVANTYIFQANWESDFFCINAAGFAYEIEVKVTYSDFMADFRKEQKHRAMDRYKSGYVVERGHLHSRKVDSKVHGHYRNEYTTITVTPIHMARVPNRFFYCCPAGVIPLAKVPHYAGLLYVTDTGVRLLKKAPLLHNGKVDYTKTLLTKFYYRNMKLENDAAWWKHQVWELKERIKNLKKA